MAYELTGALAGLRRFDLSCLATYKAALNRASRLCGQQYFPYLFFRYGIEGREALLMEEVDGSVCLYRIERREEGKPYLRLFFPPMPMNIGALRHCLERVGTFNGEGRVAIHRVGEDCLGELAGLSENLRVQPVFRERLHEPRIHRDAAGRARRGSLPGRDRFSARDDVEIRDFAASDALDCLALSNARPERRDEDDESVARRQYTSNCVKYASFFDARDLFGKVALVGGEIRAFGFAGEIHRDLAILSIVHSDPRIAGLNRYLSHRLLDELAPYRRVNSGVAHMSGRCSVGEARCPGGTHGVFRVSLDAGWRKRERSKDVFRLVRGACQGRGR